MKTEIKDKELEVIQKEVGAVIAYAQSMSITSDKTFETAAQFLSGIAASKKKIEERRKFFVKPLNDQVDRINDLFKGYLRPLNEAREIIDGKLISWNRKKEAERLVEEARIREEAEKLAKKTKVSVQEILESAPVAEVQKTTGTLTITKRWSYEVIDSLVVPKEYLTVDEVKIGKAVREGVREIKGVKIYEKEVTSTR